MHTSRTLYGVCHGMLLRKKENKSYEKECAMRKDKRNKNKISLTNETSIL